MAGGVADAEEDRLVLRSRPGESLLAPGIPVDRVELVLEQVGRFLARLTVGVRVRRSRGWCLHNAFRFYLLR